MTERKWFESIAVSVQDSIPPNSMQMPASALLPKMSLRVFIEREVYVEQRVKN